LSRPHRLDFHGAIHLVQARGKEGFNIFFDANVLGRALAERRRGVSHLLRFFSLSDACCSECGTELFGYCVEPNDASLVVRTLGAPLEAFMQRLSGRYSRYLHSAQVLPNRTSAFAGRYEAKVIAPEYLPHAVRRVHALPVRCGLARRAIDYPFSSAAAYLGERATARLQTDAVRRALELKGLFGPRGYREFMEKPETPHVAELFEHGSPLDARIVGGSAFVAQAHDAAGHPSAPFTRQQLLTGVAQLLRAQSPTVFTTGDQVVLARALVAWHAVSSGTASVREVSTWFGVSAATLGKAMRHHRRASPSLFKEALPGSGPRNETLED
jgi:hypothetical protein